MRFFPHTPAEVTEMLRTIGVARVDDLFRGIPKDCRTTAALDIPMALSEQETDRHLLELAWKNNVCATSFLGGGAYRHFIPAAVAELAGRAEFVTPYTPYQPEISQGTLQAIFEYQSMLCRITGMDVANASTYDGATSLPEACLMALRIGRNRTGIAICATVHPEYRAVARTILRTSPAVITELPHDKGKLHRARLMEVLNKDTAAVVVGYPNTFGIVEDFTDIAKAVHNAGALLIVCVPEPLSLGLFEAPGAFGADIVIGEGLSFGLPTSFGGPTLGLFAAKEAYMRQMPGRIAGRTTDADGRAGFVLTLSTREQHIRREKATSNICSNQALCATTAAIYLALIGKEGFARLARINAAKAAYARKALTAIKGVRVPFEGATFNEFVVELPRAAKDVLAQLEKEMIYGGIDLSRWYPAMKNHLLVSVTEMNTKTEIDTLANKLQATF